MNQVPTLDVRELREGDATGFVRDLHASLREFGFVTFVGHGVDEHITAPAYDALRRFFALPEAVKQGYHIPGGGGARGVTVAQGAHIEGGYVSHGGAVLLDDHSIRSLSAPGPVATLRAR